MLYNISCKGFKIADESLKYIDKHTKKIAKFFPALKQDLALMEIIIRRQRRKRLNRKEKNFDTVNQGVHITSKNPKAENPVYYEGKIILRLPIKPLVARLTGNNLDEAIKDGFKQLTKEIIKYNGRY